MHWHAAHDICAGHVQEMRQPALALLATMASVSPRQAGARMRHWAGVRAALAGLGLPERAIAACKQFVAQVPL